MAKLSGRAFCTLFVGALVLCLGSSDMGYAQSIERENIPRELRGWIPWAIYDAPEFRCAYIDNEPVCQWPGELSLELNQAGGRFEYFVDTQTKGGVILPGSARNWPQSVRSDGRRAVVVETGTGRPETTLKPGEWRITGRFSWAELPDRIAIPLRTALVKLVVDGRAIENPRRSSSGELWLESGPQPEVAEQSDRVDVDVYRHVVDGIPLLVETLLRLRVAGKAREVNLGPVLLEGFTVRDVSGDVPARIDQAGDLRLQVRAGEFQIRVRAHNEYNPAALTAPEMPEPWPDAEVWSWQADEVLRQVKLSGAQGIDSARTQMPAEWRELPAYRLSQEQVLELNTVRRGVVETPADKIHLERTMLLDFDGRGYTVRDHLSGKLSQTQRLDLEAGGVLGNVSLDGEDQLITAQPESGRSGVELRRTELDMRADWRLEDAVDRLPAVGWSRDVQSLGSRVVLPPGWTLLGVGGVDKVRGTWWDSWNLWIFFVVLVIALAVAKLTRWYYGAAALAMLVICHNEAESPFYIWLALAVMITLLRVIQTGRLAFLLRVAWWMFAFAFFMSAVPFVVSQIRGGIYPQIRDHGYSGDYDYETSRSAKSTRLGGEYSKRNAPQEELPAQMPESLAQVDSKEFALSMEEPGRGGGAPQQIMTKQQVVETGAVVQTGPGLPYWSWAEFPLHFSGPVKKDHQISLFLVSPLTNLGLAIARVLLVIFIGAVLIRRAVGFGAHRKPFQKESVGPTAALLLPLVFGALTLWPGGAEAETAPDQSYLDELKERLTQRAECHPHCLGTASIEVQIAEERVEVAAEVHAGEDIGWPLPGPAENWMPETITVDGRSLKTLVLQENGFYYLRLEPGIHSVVAASPLPNSGVITLEFQNKPRSLVIEAPGWDVEGVPASGPIEDSIRLSRIADPDDSNEIVRGDDEVHYPSWFSMHRTFSFGVEWQVHTRLTRETPAGSQAFLRMPLLPGERVNSPHVQVEEGNVVLALGRDDASLEWVSTLETTNWMQLSAAREQTWNETWELRCSSIWPCVPSGIAPTRIEKDQMFVSLYRPLPGEQLEIGFSKPVGIEGQSVTIDSTNLSVRPGVRLAAYKLELDVRTSNGGSQTLVLPEGASVESVTADGEEKTYRKEGSQLEISLAPGAQSIAVAWQQEGGISTLFRMPAIGLGHPGVNAVQEIQLDSERWIILAGGPQWGPAVLFWGFFIAVIFAAMLLGRVQFSPLSSLQWALLAIGLTQIPVGASLIIVAWFLVMALREKGRFVQGRRGHNFLQVVLVIFTLIAAGSLLAAVYSGLAVRPDMQVMGGYASELSWYSDRVGDQLPQPWVLSVHLGIWKLIMLAWALWLAASLIKWGPWVYRAYSSGGAWDKKQPKITS